MKKHHLWYAQDINKEPSPENTIRKEFYTWLGMTWYAFRNPQAHAAVEANRFRTFKVGK